MKKLIIHLTKNKVAILEYPEGCTEEDIGIILQRIDEIPIERAWAMITIARNGKQTTISRNTMAECEKYRQEKYPDWIVIKAIEHTLD